MVRADRIRFDVRTRTSTYSGKRSLPIIRLLSHVDLTDVLRDEMHLGPEAHKMIGQGIAADVAESHGESWFAHEGSKDAGKEAPVS